MNSWLRREYLMRRSRLTLHSALMGVDAAACDSRAVKSADVRDTPSVGGNVWAHHTDLWEIESLIRTPPDPDSWWISIPQTRSNSRRALPPIRWPRGQLFDFVPCNVSAILMDETRRRRLSDASLLGVRVISKLLRAFCVISEYVHINRHNTGKRRITLSNIDYCF